MIRDSDPGDQVLPHDRDAERALLAAMLNAPDCIPSVSAVLDAGDLFCDGHQRIYAAVEDCYRGGAVPDAPLVSGALSREGRLADIGGIEYLADLITGFGTGANALHYANIVREHAIRRKAIHAATVLLRDASDPRRPARQILDGWGEAFASIKARADRGTETQFKIYSDAEFRAGDFRPNWLIKNVLVRGEPCGIGAAMKSLKTSLACDMALSLATGTPFVGTFEVVAPVGTLFLSGESGRGTTQMLRNRVMDAKVLHDTDLDRMYWMFDTPQLDDVRGMTQLVEEYTKRDVVVAILDPLYLMFGNVDPANIFAAGQALRTVARLFSERGITPILIHHAKRSLKPGDKMELADLSHAGFAEFVRQWLLINRNNEYQYDGRHSLNLRIGGSAGHSGEYVVEVDEGTLGEDFTGRKWGVAVQPAAESRQAKVDDREERKAEQASQAVLRENAKLLDAIDKETEKGEAGATKNAILIRCGWKSAKAAEVINRLLGDGQIEPHDFQKGIGSNAKRPVVGYRRPVKVEQSDIPFDYQANHAGPCRENDDLPGCPAWSGPTTEPSPDHAGWEASLYREAPTVRDGMVCNTNQPSSTKKASSKSKRKSRKAEDHTSKLRDKDGSIPSAI